MKTREDLIKAAEMIYRRWRSIRNQVLAGDYEALQDNADDALSASEKFVEDLAYSDDEVFD